MAENREVVSFYLRPEEDEGLTCFLCGRKVVSHSFRFKHPSGAIHTIGVHLSCADAQVKGEWANWPKIRPPGPM